MKKILVAVGRKHADDLRWQALICQNYVDWVRSAFPDAEVVPVDYTDADRLHALLPETAGVVLTGGKDINPKLYSEPAHPKAGEPDDLRDAFDASLFERAYEASIPLLGICRGMQMANVKLGGKLIQHIGEQHMGTGGGKKEDTRHPIAICKGSHLEKIMGSTTVTVNSSHHQAVDPDHVGTNLVVTATSKGPQGEDIIEALETTEPGRYMVLVEWHPERMADEEPSKRILGGFRAAIADNERS